jgi:hypothetical protein
MGSGGFFITYFAAGIFGFVGLSVALIRDVLIFPTFLRNVLGGNFALVGAPSVGASGAIFGTLAVTWVDLFAHWRYHQRPVRMVSVDRSNSHARTDVYETANHHDYRTCYWRGNRLYPL